MGKETLNKQETANSDLGAVSMSFDSLIGRLKEQELIEEEQRKQQIRAEIQ